MKYVRPNYYKAFECIANRCPDTCCAGWEIVIDPKTLAKYESMDGPIGNRLHNSITKKSSCFVQYEQNCAFLNEDKLCDLYAEAGPEFLCHTCKTYPRHMEEYKTTREFTLMLSCPEAARIILGQQEPITFISSTKKDTKKQIEKMKKRDVEFDQEFYEILLQSRSMIYHLLQDRTIDVKVRMALALAFSHDLQSRIDSRNFDEAVGLINHYQKASVQLKLMDKLERYYDQPKEYYRLRKAWMKTCSKLHVLRPEWSDRTVLARYLLYGDGIDVYQNLSNKWYLEQERQEIVIGQHKESAEKIDMSILMENLMIYFVYGYFTGAVYDEAAYAKMKLAVFSCLVVEEYLKAMRLEIGEELTFDQMIECIHCFSRELEHLDQNLDLLEETFTSSKDYTLEAFLICLLANK